MLKRQKTADHGPAENRHEHQQRRPGGQAGAPEYAPERMQRRQADDKVYRPGIAEPVQFAGHDAAAATVRAALSVRFFLSRKLSDRNWPQAARISRPRGSRTGLA